MKKFILIVILLFIANTGFTQERKLKEAQPTMMELTLFEIKLNPNDTMFRSVDFSHLPLKGFPSFTADYNQSFYTVAQRDSILRKVDALFFEME